MVDAGMTDPLRLAELLCARLCHDLSGPLGSLLGAVELAAEETGGSETLSVAEEGATSLGRRLKLFRAAWSANSGPANAVELAYLAEGLPSRARVTLDLSHLEASEAFTPDVGRLLLNMVILASEGLPAGGTVVLAGSLEQGIAATIDGPRAAWPAGQAIGSGVIRRLGTRSETRARSRGP